MEKVSLMSKSNLLWAIAAVVAAAPLLAQAEVFDTVEEISNLNRLKVIKKLREDAGIPVTQPTSAPTGTGPAPAAPPAPRLPILRGINGDPSRPIAKLADPATGAVSLVRQGESTPAGCRVTNIAAISVDVLCPGSRTAATIRYSAQESATVARPMMPPMASPAAAPTPTPGGPVGQAATPNRGGA
ncbi:hypothetical protein [Cupriavidus pauculus]|uniref:hypothetical protein n=1 Tax=Cupriavidus pauculus TaxID=82633 RepID=UPI003857F399